VWADGVQPQSHWLSNDSKSKRKVWAQLVQKTDTAVSWFISSVHTYSGVRVIIAYSAAVNTEKPAAQYVYSPPKLQSHNTTAKSGCFEVDHAISTYSATTVTAIDNY
jgi:hypothetical protein